MRLLVSILSYLPLELSLITVVEFNEEQRGVFCVFSGDGVNKLRDYLNETEEQRYANLSDEMSYDEDGDNEDESQNTITGLFQNTGIGGMDDLDE